MLWLFAMYCFFGIVIIVYSGPAWAMSLDQLLFGPNNHLMHIGHADGFFFMDMSCRKASGPIFWHVAGTVLGCILGASRMHWISSLPARLTALSPHWRDQIWLADASRKLPIANAKILRKWKVYWRVLFLKTWKSQLVEAHFQRENHTSGDFRRSVKIFRVEYLYRGLWVRIPGYVWICNVADVSDQFHEQIGVVT